MIIVDDVYKRYQTDHGLGKWVLQGVSFTIPPRLNVGLVGSNGAGKSTLLRLIGGVDIPSRGRVERDCRVSWPMGFGGGLQGTLTGRQNAKFVCRIHGHEDDIPERIAFIQEFSELGEAFDEPVKTYSSGMKSRLQFGLSLAFDFDVYISDEVTATGDAAFRKKASAAFKKLADHASLIMVSHGEGTLRQFCTAGIWLHDGHAHWFDDINDALKAYKDSQIDTRVNGVDLQHPEDEEELDPEEIEKAKRRQLAVDILEKGRSGKPETVDHEAGRGIIQAAKQAGMALVTKGQLKKLGYRLKPEATPMLRKFFPAPHNKHIDLFDLNSQCEKAENER
jgi:capsular polysaccharide transport system ATP-binding protein